ncbi:MAG: serine hydrolase, partial [Pirellulaceae bacterium]|nr:serine hydrolase [Pirellulaceae bacterium]
PLQMTSFRMDTQTTDQENWATGYTRTAEKNVAIAPEYSNAWKHGAGGYKSNIQDFAKWTLAIMQSNLITKKSRQLMWTPQPTRSGKPTRMGLGVFVTRVNGNLQVSHNGSQTEARSQMIFYPAQKKGVVVLTNCSYANPNKIATTVLEPLSKRSAGK